MRPKGLAVALTCAALAVGCSAKQEWGSEAPMGSGSSFHLAGFDAPHDPEPPRPVVEENCEQAQFLGYEFAAQRPLPKSDTISNVRSDAQDKRSPMDAVTDMLDSGAPLDPCDPSVGAWQYAPESRASFNVLDHDGLYELQVFHGARAVLKWPDGSATIFDYGPPAPWLPKELQPSLKREWSRDKECRARGVHPHLILFTDPGNQPKAIESLDRMCSHLQVATKAAPKPSDTEWCCP